MTIGKIEFGPNMEIPIPAMKRGEDGLLYFCPKCAFMWLGILLALLIAYNLYLKKQLKTLTFDKD